MKKKRKKKKGETNMLDESYEVTLDELARKNAQIKPSKRIFEGIACQRSFFVFSQQNRFRIAVYHITQSSKFETVILVMIILSSLKLVYDTYLLDLPKDDRQVRLSLLIHVGDNL